MSAGTPPGPRGRLLLGSLREFSEDLLGFFTTCAREHGDVVRIRLAATTGYLVNHPDFIEQILLGRHRQFIKHRWFWGQVRAIFGEGLLTSEGDFWLRQRKLMAPAFHGDRISGYGDVMVREAERMLETWRAGEIRNAHDDMMRLTMRIVARTLFDSEVETEVEDVGRAFDAVVGEIAVRFRRPFRVPDWVPIPGNRRYLSGVRSLNELVYGFIEEHRSTSRERSDLLTMLMEARDDDGRPMTDRQIRDEAVTLFLAGHETTALSLSWTWYLLSQHPEVEAKLLEELGAVLSGRAPSVEDLPRLVYTEKVVKESMRLYPPAYAIGRESLEGFELDGYRIPARSVIFISPWVMHRDPRYYERAEEFRPGRWSSDFAEKLPRFAYLPFGGGPRVCLGNRFAMMEAILILATVAQRFRLTWQPDRPVTPFTTITLRPDGGVWVRLSRR